MAAVDMRSKCRPEGIEKLIEGVLCVLVLSLAIAWPACRVQAESGSAGDEGVRDTQTLVVSSYADSGPGSLRARSRRKS